MLTTEGVRAWYGRTQALFDVTLSVAEGETVGLVGANGAGKTTILRSVIGAVTTSGSVRIDGQETVKTATHRKIRRFDIGVVHEGRGLFQRRSVQENLRAGLSRSDDQDLGHVLRLFPELDGRLATTVSKLSGGEQQMVALGRCVLRKPRLLLLDEPSLGLAPQVVDRIYEALHEMRTDGMAILLVEQNINRTATFADRLCHVRLGTISSSVSSSDSEGVARISDAILGAEAAASPSDLATTPNKMRSDRK